MSDHRIRFTLNGEAQEVDVPADRTVLDLLRLDLGHTGTKEGCSIGVCGLCTILVDGAPLSGCLLFAVQLNGTAVRTVEGLGSGGLLDPLQQAFIDEGGYQCGICTAGQRMSAPALLVWPVAGGVAVPCRRGSGPAAWCWCSRSPDGRGGGLGVADRRDAPGGAGEVERDRRQHEPGAVG